MSLMQDQIEALRQAIAEAEKQPVHAVDMSQERVDETAKDRHEWVGLTEGEVHDAFNFVEFIKQISFDRDRPEWCENFAAYLEAKLKEKNQ